MNKFTEQANQIITNQYGNFGGGFQQFQREGQFRSVMSRILGWGDNRDIITDLGFADPTIENLESLYRRGDIAKACGDVFPDAVWNNLIHITDDPSLDLGEMTPFMEDIHYLAKHKNLFQWLQQLHKTTAYSPYVVLYIGAMDGGKLTSELGTLDGPEDIGFFNVFSEPNAQLFGLYEEYQGDPNLLGDVITQQTPMMPKSTRSDRFGMPEYYNIKFGGTYEGISSRTGLTGGTRLSKREVSVHHSRLIHCRAEAPTENHLIGEPILAAVYFQLVSLMKISLGTAEGVYNGNKFSHYINIQADANLSEADKQKLLDTYQNWSTKQREGMVLQHADIKSVTPQVANPRDPYDICLMNICATLGFPKARLVGVQEAKIASVQDEATWASRVAAKRMEYAEPHILRPIIDRLVEMGAVRPPKDDEYEIVWPALVADTQKDKIDNLNKFMAAFRAKREAEAKGDWVLTDRQFVESAGYEYDEKAIEEIMEEVDKELEEERIRTEQFELDKMDNGKAMDKDDPNNESARVEPPVTRSNSIDDLYHGI